MENNLQLQEEFAVISPGASHSVTGHSFYKGLRTVHFPLQSLWAELFFLAAQVTVPTILQILPAILPFSFHFSIHPFLFYSTSSFSPPSGEAQAAELSPVILQRTLFQHNFVWKHAFTTGGQKPLKKLKRRKEPFYHIIRGMCLEHLPVSHLHYILNLVTLCTFVYTRDRSGKQLPPRMILQPTAPLEQQKSSDVSQS